MKLLTTCLLICFAVSVKAGDVEDLWKAYQKNSGHLTHETRQAGNADTVRTNSTAEIGIERKPPFIGSGPSYCVVIEKDGTFVYEGVKRVKHIGRFRGKLLPGSFTQLGLLLEDIGYYELPDNTIPMCTDGPAVITTAVRMGERKFVVNMRPYTGLTTLWALEKTVLHLVHESIENEPKDTR